MRKILLIGNPNVGKSAIFSRLTGARVLISNYPGTTVEFTQGFLKIGDEKA
ncbi:MAG: 50S ribosome-binding GTPase, partial [Candidatus Omnitrophica bacterium]|nr:50S ribosome-binding GTPase [Candidatus Omnitrophota bacterium]